MDQTDDAEPRDYIKNHILTWIRAHANWHGIETNDLEAVKLLKEWCIWLITLETAVVAGLAALAKNITLLWEAGYLYARIFAFVTVLSLGVSTKAIRTVETLWQELGKIVGCFSPEECANCLRHSGYFQSA